MNGSTMANFALRKLALIALALTVSLFAGGSEARNDLLRTGSAVVLRRAST
jgi:hypothetical protein